MSEQNETGQAAPETAAQTSQVDLSTLPTVPAGEPLVDHEVYIDVVSRGHGPIRALPGQAAGTGNGYVAEKSVDPATWDALVREDGEIRLQRQTAQEAEPGPFNPSDSPIPSSGTTG